MGVSIWEGQKASDLIDAIKNRGNEIGITQNFADALLAVFDSVVFEDTNGVIALSHLRDVMNAILSDTFVSMTDYYILSGYGASDTPNSWYGAVARNDRSLLVSELESIKIPAKSSTSQTTYDTELAYSFIRVPAGATQVKQINTGGITFNMRPLIYDGSHFTKEGVTPPSGSSDFFSIPNNTYKDVSAWNDGSYYLQGFYGSAISSGTAVAVVFK